MKIGIDARMYGAKQGGIGRYIEQLITNLENIACHSRFPKGTPSGRGDDKLDNLEFVIFLRKENWNEYTPKNNKFKKVLADISWYGWKEQIILPFIFYKEKIDLMHFPHWNVPLLYNKKFMVTVHDLLLLHFPTRSASALGPVSYFFKSLAYKIILYRTVKSAQKIITVSEFSKQDIVKTLKINPEKITVTHLAPFTTLKYENNKTPPVIARSEWNERRGNPLDTTTPQHHLSLRGVSGTNDVATPSTQQHYNIKTLKQDNNITTPVIARSEATWQSPLHHNATTLKYENIKTLKQDNNLAIQQSIARPYVLYVGNAYPHKNLNKLLKAWSIFKNKYSQEYQLVLAGKKDFFYKKLSTYFESNKKQLNLQSDDIIFTDFVSDHELSILYARASLYVFPSCYEGFGLPPLEAMQYQIPVVSSKSTAMPEILGDSAWYFDPDNIQEMAQAIHTGLTNPEIRSKLIKNSQNLLLKYSWETLTSATLRVYQKTVDKL